MVGSRELESMRGNAADLVALRRDAASKFLEIPGASHFSVLSAGPQCALHRTGRHKSYI